MVALQQNQLSVEDRFLHWLELQPFTLTELVEECTAFLRECHDISMPMVEWIAVNGHDVGMEEAMASMLAYLRPVVHRPNRAVSPPPQRSHAIPAAVNSPSQEMQLLMELLTNIAMGQTPPHQIVAAHDTHEAHEQIRSRPQRVSFLSTVAWFITWILAILAVCLLINTGSRTLFSRDIPNELHILWASRSIPDFALSENGEYLAWDRGDITFYSHDVACSPAFRAIGGDGTLLPPPSTWPEKDAVTLLETAYLGCAPTSNYRTWSGYWGESPWGMLVVSDQAWIKENEFLDGSESVSKDFSMWIEYKSVGVNKKDFATIGAEDLEHTGGAIGQTNPITPSTPLSIQSPSPFPVAPEQPQNQPISDSGSSGSQPFVPVSAPTNPPVLPTNTPYIPEPTPIGQGQVEVYVEATAVPFATQTPEPVIQPTVDLVAAAAVLHQAQTAQASAPRGGGGGGASQIVPTSVGHLQAPQSTPNDVVNSLPCTGCHSSP